MTTLDGRIAAFTVGAAFGAATIVVLRHELPLEARAQTVAALGGVGLLLAAVAWIWSRRLRTAPGGPAEARPWTVFAWCTTILVLCYVTLVAIVLFL